MGLLTVAYVQEGEIEERKRLCERKRVRERVEWRKQRHGERE